MILNIFIDALLSDATYALEDNNIDGLTGGSLKSLIALRDRMTPTLADYIGDHFTVVTHIESDDISGSGFDATVWRDNQTGKLFVSMQGSKGLQDFLTDVDLAVTGDARAQVVDMVNWWLKISTPTGQMAPQIAPEEIYDGSTPPLMIGTHYVAASGVAGTGLVSAADLAQGIEVNGHSLGGYLATAFTRLFGAQANVEHTSTFNSAGFNGDSAEFFFAEIQELLGTRLSGFVPVEAKQTNFFVENGIEVATNYSGTSMPHGRGRFPEADSIGKRTFW